MGWDGLLEWAEAFCTSSVRLVKPLRAIRWGDDELELIPEQHDAAPVAAWMHAAALAALASDDAQSAGMPD